MTVLGLSQVLVETTGGSTMRYVYGHDLLAEYDGTEWTYHLNDGLGSVRQLADASGDVILAQGYTPFGVPLWSEGNGSTGYGFTGERWEAYAELLFLRARYYEPGTGRFIQRDVWDGDSQQPQSLHPYSYVQNNAPNWIDPTGLTPDYQPDLPNHRDLTLWLYNEIRQNSDSYYVRRISELRRQSAPSSQIRAYAAWALLVKDRAKWDFKHNIRRELGSSIVLHHTDGYQWYEYSIPGNIFYGFVGLAAGFSGFEIHAGASYAEVTDPAHASEACCPQACFLGALPGSPPQLTHYCFSLGCYYVNPDWFSTGFDEPGDWWNVEFGIKMFRTYGKHMSLCQFQDFLAIHGHWLTPGKEQEWHWAERPGEWPYKVGYFDGPNESKYEVPIMMLLVPW